TSMPTLVNPATSAVSIMYPDRRVSLPTTTRCLCSPRRKWRPAAWPTFMAVMASSKPPLARPRMPSVPKYLRSIRSLAGPAIAITRCACNVTRGEGHSPARRLDFRRPVGRARARLGVVRQRREWTPGGGLRADRFGLAARPADVDRAARGCAAGHRDRADDRHRARRPGRAADAADVLPRARRRNAVLGLRDARAARGLSDPGSRGRGAGRRG